MRPHGDVQQQLGATLRPGDDQAVEHAGHAVGTPASARSQAVALRSTLGLVLDGSTVTIVVPGGPAWRAVQDGERIEVGDLVRSVDGQQITSRNAADALRGADLPGTPVRIEVEKRPSTASGKWTARDLSVYPAQQVKVTEFVVVRQDIEMVMLLKNVQSALGTVWKAVGDGGRVQKPLEDLERCFDSVVAYAADDEARLCQAVRELERKSGASAGRGLQDVDLAMLSQQAAHEVRQARQRIRTLEMQLAMVGNEIDGSREEERRARAAALEAQEAFRRNDADLRAEIENLQEGMVRLDRRVRDESARADEERERADRLIEEARILRSNTEAMQLELERHDVIKNKSAKQSSEAVALALREVLLVQDELSAAKNEIEQLRESEQLVNERLRVIEAARDTIDLGEGHRNEQLKTLRSEIVFLRKTIEAVKDERDQMREHIAKQAREIVLLDSRLSDKAAADNADLEATKAHLFKVQNALRLRETQVMALEEELRRRTQFNSQQAHAKTSGATTANKGATGGQRGVVPLFNARFDDVQYVLLAALFMALLLLILRSLQTLGESSVLQAVGMGVGITFWLFVALALFKCAVWCHARFVGGPLPTTVTSLPEKTPLLPTAAEGYQQIQDQQVSNYGSRPPSQLGEKESLRNPEFKSFSKPASVYTPALTAGSRDSEYPSAYDATQKYLSMTSGRPLSSQIIPPQDAPYQAQARELGMEQGAADPAMTARSSIGTSMMSRRSREERLASLKSVVKRHDDISMA